MNRRGAVLLTTLAALLLLGGVTAALLLAVLHDARAARNAEASLVARAAASAAIAHATAEGDAWVGVLPVGGGAILRGTLAGSSYEARLLRAGDGLIAVRGVGVDGRLGMRREVATTLRMLPLLPRQRAVTVLRRSPAPLLSARVFAADSAPPGWVCPGPGASAPPFTDATAPDSAFFALGPLAWPAVAAWTGKPRALDSLTPQAFSADLTLDGRRAIGVLVVDGVLTLRGGAEVLGVVVARRGLVFGPGGGALWGTLVAESLGMVSGVIPASVRVGYSSCVAGRTARSGAPLLGLPGLPPVDVW